MNLFRFISGSDLICPFCLELNSRRKDTLLCLNQDCGKELPVLYKDPEKSMPPFPVQVFGWSQHGKTTYLAALTMMLMKMRCLWESYTWLAVTDTSQGKVREINIHERNGTVPRPTLMGSDDCYVMMLRKMEPWGDRAMLVRDCPGEIFKDMDVPLDHAPFLRRARTIFMFISLPDLLDPKEGDQTFEGQTMEMLITNFLHTLKKHKLDLRGRRMILVLTKADLIRDLPTGLRDYLLDDVLWTAASSQDPKSVLRDYLGSFGNSLASAFVKRYFEGMKEADIAIRRWLERDHNAQNFIGLAEEYKVDLRLSLTSSTGGNVEPGSGLDQRWEPRRVLDPFFWALELERQDTLRFRLGGMWSAAKAWGRSIRPPTAC
jgi:hypothetical protein